MKYLKSVSLKHGFVTLLHEKPFAGVNGSGKHVNWSVSDSSGRNLLDPGATPNENLVFLTFLCGVLLGVHDNADALRASIASAGNDHRLGANEAPPAIISIFLGSLLDKILNAIETGATDKLNVEKMMIDLGVAHIPNVAKDNTDRNRTSPFAFTGNKFEFRAVGSSASIGYPTAILNAAVCDGLAKINAQLEEKTTAKKVLSSNDLLGILRTVIIATKNIRFEGNGYSEQWRNLAHERGLSHFTDTAQALLVLKDKEKTQFLLTAGVFQGQDIESRLVIQQERYIKQNTIECHCAVEMAQTQVLPACVNYHKQLLKTAQLASELNVPSCAKILATEFGEMTLRLQNSLNAFKIQLEKLTAETVGHENLEKMCSQFSEHVLPKLKILRDAVDAVEAYVPHDMWPYPKYSHMLFGIE